MITEQFNPLDLADAYKISHDGFYDDNMTLVSSYGCSRFGAKWPVTMVAGYQYHLQKYLTVRLTPQHVIDFNADCEAMFPQNPFPFESMMYIATELEGRWPIEIVAVPEGTLVPSEEPQWVVESTDSKATLAVQWLETFVLPAFWTGSTVATNSFFFKMAAMKALLDSGGSLDSLAYMVHDFGQRGTIFENARVGGYGHGLNFSGSDNLLGRRLAIDYYNAPKDVIGTIPASEHSVMTARGREGEFAMFDKMLEMYGSTIFACVIDSYDMTAMLDHIISRKDRIVELGGRVVVRPDSGVPEESVQQCLDMLADGFGYTTNAEGYKILHPSVRVIQGDGISSPERATELYEYIMANWYAAENLALGSGGGLLQILNRDTQRYAQKTSYIEYDGVGVDVYKDPITAKGVDTKTSRKGRQTVKDGIVVYRNGDVMNTQEWVDIKLRATMEAEHYFKNNTARNY